MTLKVNRTTAYAVELDEEYAGKLMRSLGRVLTAVDRMDPNMRTGLVNTHTVDDLLALKTALYMALPEDTHGREGSTA
jgi:hypothetical protein